MKSVHKSNKRTDNTKLITWILSDLWWQVNTTPIVAYEITGYRMISWNIAGNDYAGSGIIKNSQLPREFSQLSTGKINPTGNNTISG